MLRTLNPYPIAMTMAAAVLLNGCRKPQPEVAPTRVVMGTAAALPSDPLDSGWATAPEYVAGLIPQDLVEPRLMTPSTAELRVRTLTDGNHVAFRLEWKDETQDDLATSATFPDACAVQFPAKTEPTIPAPQMGETGKPVAITFWSAAWQASVDGRGTEITDIYPNMTVDHYPFRAQSLEPGSPEQRAMETRYAPARALGNLMSGPRDSAVDDLVAEGPGTLTRAASPVSEGLGRRTDRGWAVVIRRPLPDGFANLPHGQVAFAVWEGTHAEVGARKMRTPWITLAVKERP